MWLQVRLCAPPCNLIHQGRSNRVRADYSRPRYSVILFKILPPATTVVRSLFFSIVCTGFLKEPFGSWYVYIFYYDTCCQDILLTAKTVSPRLLHKYINN